MASSGIKVLITGSKGQVGNELQYLASLYPDLKLAFFDRSSLDICSEDEVQKIFDEYQPDFLINTAAYTAVDKAEKDELSAFKTNAEAIEILSAACLKYSCWFIHLSTDYVYHYNSASPLKETDPTLAVGVYARTKLKGENILQASGCRYCTIRTSWVYSFFGKNFVKTMLRLGKEKSELHIVDDQIGDPTYALDLAETLLEMVNKISRSSSTDHFDGTYNYSNLGQISWFHFAETIFNLERIDCSLIPTSSAEYGAPAPRPAWSVLDKSKMTDTFGINPKDWKQSLVHCLSRLAKEN